jgi:hypothetical protein
MKSRVIQDEPDRPGRSTAAPATDRPPARRIPTWAVLLVLLAVAVLIGGLLLGYTLS